jgi:hypothetical protein
MRDPEGDLAAAAKATEAAKTEVDADAKKEAGKTAAEKSEDADKAKSKEQDALGGELAKLSKEEEEEAAK